MPTDLLLAAEKVRSIVEDTRHPGRWVWVPNDFPCDCNSGAPYGSKCLHHDYYRWVEST